VGPPLGPEEEQILACAALAPSSHNTQPWTVRIAEQRRWIVGVDSSRRLPAVDPANRELALSMGAFLENLSQAAGASGLAAELEVLSLARGAAELCTVRLAPAAGRDERALERIRSRATVRKGYGSERI
jgi:nitroreductase